MYSRSTAAKRRQRWEARPVSLHLYVDDVDACFQKAVAAGATERKPVMDQFYGNRSG
jgi:PhnB protein